MLREKPIGNEILAMLIFSVFLHAGIITVLIYHNKITSRLIKPKEDKLDFMWVRPASKAALKKYRGKLPAPMVPPHISAKPKKKPKIVSKSKSDTRKSDEKKQKDKKLEKDQSREVIAKALANIYTDLGKRPEPKSDNYNFDEKALRESGTGGSGNVPENMEIYLYKSSIYNLLTSNWFIINKALLRQLKDPTVRLLIKLNGEGYIVNRKVEKSSGNQYYDRSVIRAVDKSEPFPPPPEVLKKEVLAEGIIIDFTPPPDY